MAKIYLALAMDSQELGDSREPEIRKDRDVGMTGSYRWADGKTIKLDSLPEMNWFKKNITWNDSNIIMCSISPYFTLQQIYQSIYDVALVLVTLCRLHGGSYKLLCVQDVATCWRPSRSSTCRAIGSRGPCAVLILEWTSCFGPVDVALSLLQITVCYYTFYKYWDASSVVCTCVWLGNFVLLHKNHYSTCFF